MSVARTLERLSSRPFADVEISTLCDARCAFCPRAAIERPRGLMSAETLDATAAWLPRGTRVTFSGLGEPMRHPRVADFVGRMRAAGHEVGVTAQAAQLVEDRTRALLDAGAAFLYASFPAADRALFETLAPGASFDTAVENLDALAAMRPERFPVYLAAPLIGSGPDPRPGLAAFAAARGFTLQARRAHSRGGAWYVPARAPAPGCGIFAKVVFVAFDGAVLACCNDVTGATRLGSVADPPFERLLEIKRDRIEQGALFEACARCDDDYRWVLLGGKAPPWVEAG